MSPYAKPTQGDQGLAEGPRLALAGSVEGLAYPPLCPYCGSAARQVLPVRKVFLIDGRGETASERRIIEARPMFCGPCIERHRAEGPAPSWMDAAKTALFSRMTFPAAALTVFGLMMTQALLPRGLAHLRQSWWLFLLSGGFVVLGLLTVRSAWTTTRWKRTPLQSTVTRAFDFGDDPTTMFENRPRTYVIRSPACAAAFEQLNAGRSSELLGPERQARKSRFGWMVAAVILVLAVVAWLTSHGR